MAKVYEFGSASDLATPRVEIYPKETIVNEQRDLANL